MWRTIVPVVMGITLAGCARATMLDSTVPDSDSIFAPDIVAVRASDAYQAVQRLRPEFLHGRSNPTLAGQGEEPVQVYLDDTALGGPESLRSVPLGKVTQIRYLSPAQAMIRWGIRYLNGVILVSTSPFRN